MEISFEAANRTEWKVNDHILFFRQLRSLFPQLNSGDLEEIEEHLENPKDCTFEVAHYDDNIPVEGPAIIALFDQGKVFLDFLVPPVMRRQLNMIEYLVKSSAKLKSSRKMNQKDWLERADRFSTIIDQENN